MGNYVSLMLMLVDNLMGYIYGFPTSADPGFDAGAYIPKFRPLIF